VIVKHALLSNLSASLAQLCYKIIELPSHNQWDRIVSDLRLDCLRSKFFGGYAVLEQEPVKVPPRNSSFLGRCRNVAATLPKEAQDSLTLEFTDEPFLPRKQAIVGGTREAAGFLQVKG